MGTEALSVHIFSTASRVLLVFIAYALLLLTTAGVVSTAGWVGDPSVPAGSVQGLPIVALASAGLITWFILRSPWVGVKLACGLAVAFFGAYTVLPELNALSAPGSFSRVGAAATWFGGAVFAATFCTAAVVLLARTGRGERGTREPAQATSVLVACVQLMAAVAFQVIVHASLGCRVGWYPAPNGLAFHGPLGLVCPDVVSSNTSRLASSSAELAWGIVAALVALLLVRSLRRGAAEAALAVGLFFALTGPVHELLPCPLAPGAWALGERSSLAVSQFICGAVLALWFSWRAPAFLQAHRPSLGSAPAGAAARRDRHGAGGMAS